MNVFQIITFLGLVFNAVNCDIKLEPRIVGGNIVTDPGQFPYQVSLKLANYQNGHICGGSIIDSRHVVTAAHCVLNQKRKELNIWAGGNTLFNNGSFHTVQHIFIHENYQEDTNKNDIAIIRVANKFIESSVIKRVKINNNIISDYTKCNISGWGLLSENGASTNDMRYASIMTLNHTICKTQYLGVVNITDNMLCAGLIDGTKDTCQGDSGGPLICNNRLAGIVSFGVGCAQATFPGVYTKVSAYTTWIQKQIARSHAHPNLQQIHIIAMIMSMTLYKLIFDF
ncbi:uncharacterized protein CBL_04953 [Carabus blaptoides fortunei]